jgi:hypothetical protein
VDPLVGDDDERRVRAHGTGRKGVGAGTAGGAVRVPGASVVGGWLRERQTEGKEAHAGLLGELGRNGARLVGAPPIQQAVELQDVGLRGDELLRGGAGGVRGHVGEEEDEARAEARGVPLEVEDLVVGHGALKEGLGGQGLEEPAGLVEDERAQARELAGAILVLGKQLRSSGAHGEDLQAQGRSHVITCAQARRGASAAGCSVVH